MNNVKLGPWSFQGIVFLWVVFSFVGGCSEAEPDEQRVASRDLEAPVQPERVLVRGNYSEPSSLDPATQPGQGTYILWDLYEGLVTSGPNGQVRPGVAERWETEDYRTYIFHIRQDARWSNGDPVTAHDFVYSWRRLVDPAQANYQGIYLSSIQIKNAKAIIAEEMPVESLGVTAVDAHRLQVTLERPSSIFIDTLTHFSTMPIHRDSVEKYPETWTRPEHNVSNGAFRLADWSVNERVDLQRNKYYWDSANVKLDKVIFLPVSSPSAEVTRYRAGDLAITNSIPPAQFSRLKRMIPEQFKNPLVTATAMLDFNGKEPPLDDSDLRKALAYAIDREMLASKVLGRGERPAYTLTPVTMAKFALPNSHWSQWTQAKREKEAKRLYLNAGYSSDQPLKLEIKYPNNEVDRSKVLAIASMWQRVLGVDSTLTNLDDNTLGDAFLTSDYQVALWNLWAEFNDPYSILSVMLSESAGPVNGYREPRYDDLLAKAMSAMDENERNAIYMQAEILFAEDMRSTPLYQLSDRKLVKPFVSGYSEHPLGFIYSKDLSIDDR